MTFETKDRCNVSVDSWLHLTAHYESVSVQTNSQDPTLRRDKRIKVVIRVCCGLLFIFIIIFIFASGLLGVRGQHQL